MFIRPKFVTNSSSSAFIMWGVEIERNKVKEILGYFWNSMSQENRETVWSDYQGDPDVDLSDWDTVYDYLEEDYGLGEFTYSIFDKARIDIYEVDQDEDNYVLYVKGSWKSVDRGSTYTLNQFKEHADWLPEINKELQRAGIDDEPEWFIVGAN